MFNIKVSFVGNINQKMIDAVCFAAFFSKNIKFMEIGVLCRFEINEDSWSSLYNAANNKLKLHRGFQVEIAQTAGGITRGVLHARTENTPYNKFCLTIIDVKDRISK